MDDLQSTVSNVLSNYHELLVNPKSIPPKLTPVAGFHLTLSEDKIHPVSNELYLKNNQF